MAELEAIEPFLHELMEGLAPAKRRRLIDKLMRLARRANAKRIRANTTPEGRRMAPRKKRPNDQRRKMFTRISRQDSLRIRATPDQGELRFANPLIQDTAATHHYGLVGFVGRTRDRRVIRTKYQARELLGFGAEQAELLDEALKHLTGG
jgi:phage virion morphogenesis protein